ncbi:MAG: Crp/Fnr family transcriptional regulator [Bacteroidota bacterium]
MDKSALIALIKKLYPHISEASLEAFLQHADYITFPRGTKLIKEGQSHPFFYFMLKGGVKSYYLKDGKEVCLWFAFEHEMIGTMKTMDGVPSNETIELLEDSEFLRFKTEEITNLAKTDIDLSHLMIIWIAEYASYLEERLYQLQFMSSKERYLSLLEAEPALLQKISLTDIASYLGVSRETVSRIRAQI